MINLNGEKDMIEESVETQDKRKLSKLAVLALFFCIVGPVIIVIDHNYIGYDPNPFWFGLGVISIFGFLSVPILAIAAMVRIHRNKELLKGKGIAIGSIVLMVMGVVLLSPLEGAMKPYERKHWQCRNNLRTSAEAIVEYAEGHDGRWPAKKNWCDQLAESIELREGVFRCPSDGEGTYSYAMNMNLPEFMGDTPGSMVLLFECIPGKNAVGGPKLVVTDRHQGLRRSEPGCNVVLSFGVTEFVKPEEIENLKWKIEKE